MKKIIYASLAIVISFAACYKPPQIQPHFTGASLADSSYLLVVQHYVQLHPIIAHYDDINFDGYRISKQNNCWYLRLPFKNKPSSSDFILLQTDSLGKVNDGKIIHLSKNVNDAVHNKYSFNGSIDISSLNHDSTLHSNITNGYIEAFHPTLFDQSLSRISNHELKADMYPMPKVDDLPEVVVVAYLPAASSSGISVGDYMLLQSMFNSNGGGGGSSASGNSGSGGGGSSSSIGNGSGNGYGIYTQLDYGNPSTPQPIAGGIAPHQDPNYDLNYEESFFRPAIDLNAWFKCLNDIPDAGADCSITLYGDVPVSSDPGMGINLWNGNTGHCFLSLSKSNGAQSVTQVIGFTAQNAFQAILNCDAYVPSKLVDNAGHKYNCSITMDITAAGLQEVMRNIDDQADMLYSVVNYDCLDFALNVFISVRPVPLQINKQPVVNDPFSNIANGPKLYTALENMLAQGSPETNEIVLGNSLHVGASHGPCN